MRKPPHPVRIFQKIVVATDFSEFASVALLRAANLALHFEASLVLAHVIDPVSAAGGSDGAPFVEMEDEPSALAKLDAEAHSLRECGIAYSLAVRNGDTRDEVSKLVEDTHADLLVLSTHGQFCFDRPVRSSVAEKILRIAPCPVMTVGPAAWLTRDAAYNSNHILFPTDLSQVSLRALPFVDAMASVSGSELTVLRVTQEAETRQSHQAAVAKLQAVIRQQVTLTRKVHCTVQGGDLGETIASEALGRNCDFVVLGVHREDLTQPPRGGLHLGLVYQIVSRTATPVISLHDRLDVQALRATQLTKVPTVA